MRALSGGQYLLTMKILGEKCTAQLSVRAHLGIGYTESVLAFRQLCLPYKAHGIECIGWPPASQHVDLAL